MSTDEHSHAISVLPRRRMLATGAAAFGALGTLTPRANAQSLPPAELTAQTTEGPYFLEGMPQRADITEGLPGVPLELRLNVIDASRTPRAGCRVDVWQCDAAGLYSGYAGQGDDMKTSTVGRSYLRGWQNTDAQGVVVFRSLYPGWYAGRTTHLHFKVKVGQQAVLTSQNFLPDALSEYLYTTLPPTSASCCAVCSAAPMALRCLPAAPCWAPCAKSAIAMWPA